MTPFELRYKQALLGDSEIEKSICATRSRHKPTNGLPTPDRSIHAALRLRVCAAREQGKTNDAGNEKSGFHVFASCVDFVAATS
jgi:hypothetical protein